MPSIFFTSLYFDLARIQLKRGYPTIMYFGAGGNVSEVYDGPTDLDSLNEFVNVKTGRGLPLVKVCPGVIVTYRYYQK